MKPVIVVINNRDLLDSVIAQIEFFLRCPNVKIVLCDNASTYPPLAEWYAKSFAVDCALVRQEGHVRHACTSYISETETEYCHHGRVDGFFFPENRGPRGQQSIFHHLWTRYDFEYYFLCEPDLDFTGVDPERLFPDLIAGMETYPNIQGVGISIRIDDLPDIPIRDTVFLHESWNWKTHPSTEMLVEGRKRISEDPRFYTGGTDTAGVLRRVKPSWDGGYEGLRSTIHIVRHLPWYHVDADWQCPNPQYIIGSNHCPNCHSAVPRPADFQYYLDHADPRGTVYTSKMLDKGDNRLQ